MQPGDLITPPGVVALLNWPRGSTMAAKCAPFTRSRHPIAPMVEWRCLLVALLVVGCGPDAPYELPIAQSPNSWFPLEPSSLQLARGDSTVLLLAVRDTSGDTLDIANLPQGRLAYENGDPPRVTMRAGTSDTSLAVFRVHVRADSSGSDTLRFAWVGVFCRQRLTPFEPLRCYPAAWFAPLEVPVVIR